MDYVTQVNEALRTELAARELTVVYGQNVNAGSRLGGLARDFSGIPGCRVINTPNTENSLVGMGFGLMLSGIPSMYAMKQQDFVLLGVDHLVNTWNALRSRGPFVPFVLAMIVVDNGWEGPQSGFNNTSGLASMSRIPAYFPTGATEIPLAVAGAFQGGPAILAVSQRLFRTEPIASDGVPVASATDSYVVYASPTESSAAPRLVILAGNFSLDHAWAMRDRASERGYDVTVVSFFKSGESVDEPLLVLCSAAEFIVSIDDQKSTLGASAGVCADVRRRLPSVRIRSVARQDPSEWALPREDSLRADPDSIIEEMGSSAHGDPACGLPQ